MRVLMLILSCAALSVCGAEKLHVVRPMVYTGTSDSSGAVAVGTNLFIVADDENNVLRLYRSDQEGPPVKEFDMSGFLGAKGKSVEADLEAGARIGDRAFWIGSHGRNVEGKLRPNRGCFFATDIKVIDGDVTLTPVGAPCRSLLDSMLADPRLARFNLLEAALKAPKSAGGLNIEGLSATPEGQLLIGFRNPVRDGKALIVPLLNPNDVVMGQKPKFGDALQLDLGGLGIRDIAYYSGTYVIIAGPCDGSGEFRIYYWKGPLSQPTQVTVHHMKGYHPEAIVVYPQLGLDEIQILSDDGTLMNHGFLNKKLNFKQRTFRSFWLSVRKPDGVKP